MSLRSVPVRWRVLFVLFIVSFVNYLLRNALSVAAPSIRTEFHFTSAELGWILGAFNISYTILMIPGGVFGERYGPRLALGSITVTWGVLTWLTGFAPNLMAATATGAFISLVAVRLLVGASNAPIFPITSGLIEGWFPPGRWALPNSVTSSGIALGQAALGPVVTALIVLYGWRVSFYLLAPLGVVSGIWWYWYARDKPHEHPAITRAEVEFIDAGRSKAPPSAAAPTSWRAALLNRDVVILAASYFCLNYVFYTFSQWLFIYLVESRGFSMLESGWLYVLPFATGAVLTAIGGWVCDTLCRRLGGLRGCRITAISGLVLVAIFLLAGVYASDPYVAVGLLSLCFGFTLFTDTTYWAATTYAAGEHTASACGMLNFGGTMPGLLAPLFGFMIDHVGWVPTIASGSVFALLGACLWLFVRLKGADGAHQPTGAGITT
jgi:ACS family glucarate transporter-like MFS transporter